MVSVKRVQFVWIGGWYYAVGAALEGRAEEGKRPRVKKRRGVRETNQKEAAGAVIL